MKHHNPASTQTPHQISPDKFATCVVGSCHYCARFDDDMWFVCDWFVWFQIRFDQHSWLCVVCVDRFHYVCLLVSMFCSYYVVLFELNTCLLMLLFVLCWHQFWQLLLLLCCVVCFANVLFDDIVGFLLDCWSCPIFVVFVDVVFVCGWDDLPCCCVFTIRLFDVVHH